MLQPEPLAPVGVLGAVVRHVGEEVPPRGDAPRARHGARREEQRRRRHRTQPQAEQRTVELPAHDQPPQAHPEGAQQQQPREDPHHRGVPHEQPRPQGPPEPPASQPGPRRREPVVDPDLAVDAAGVSEPGHEGEEHEQAAGPAPSPHAESEGGEQQQGIEQHQQRLLPEHVHAQVGREGAADRVPRRRGVVAPVDDDVGPEDRLVALDEPTQVLLEGLPPGVGPGRRAREVAVQVGALALVGLQVADQLDLEQPPRGLLVRDEHLLVQVVVAQLVEVLRADVVVEDAPQLDLSRGAEAAHLVALGVEAGAYEGGEQQAEDDAAGAGLQGGGLPAQGRDRDPEQGEEEPLVAPVPGGAEVPGDVEGDAHPDQHERREDGWTHPSSPVCSGRSRSHHGSGSLHQPLPRSLARRPVALTLSSAII